MLEIESYGIDQTSKERLNNKPYVVSADIRLLLQEWARRKGFSVPSKQFFTNLRSNFSYRMGGILPGFEMVGEEELSQGLNQIVEKNGLVPVSLDRVYYQSNPRLDIARIVEEEGNSRGLGRRSDTPFLLTQFRSLRKAGIKEVALVDDVIFSGDLIERVARTIERMRIKVPKVYAGIGITKGVNKLTQSGRKVECVKQYDEVIDEVCERDFYPGVPYSGRLLAAEGNVGAPYILPFGNPVQWASVPESYQVSFSKFCIGQSIQLFEEIERLSERQVKCSDLDRRVITLPSDSTRFVDALRDIKL